MDQLINDVAERAGISPDQARIAVQTVVDDLKTRLSTPLASQLDSVLSGQALGGMGGQAQQTLEGLGGTLDKSSGTIPS